MASERPDPHYHTIRPRLLKMLPTTKRVCLKCNKEFTSLGKCNRLCPGCNSDNIQRPKRDGDDPVTGNPYSDS